MVDVYVGLGSNIEPLRYLKQAATELQRQFGQVVSSDVYRSEPLGFDGDDFLNLVVRLRTTADPDTVAEILSSLEQAASRHRDGPKFGPRTLDLDLLLYGWRVDAKRRLPRADIALYSFVIAPLAELAPSMTHPLSGRRYSAVWRDLLATAPGVTRLGRLDALVD